jgi:hypothetical protein
MVASMSDGRDALWMTFGCTLVAAGIAVGVPLGLTVSPYGWILFVAIASFIVFAMGLYICIASFGTLPLPKIGARRQEERAQQEAEARRRLEQQEAQKAQEEAKRRQREADKDRELREKALKSIADEAQQFKDRGVNDG